MPTAFRSSGCIGSGFTVQNDAGRVTEVKSSTRDGHTAGGIGRPAAKGLRPRSAVYGSRPAAHGLRCWRIPPSGNRDPAIGVGAIAFAIVYNRESGICNTLRGVSNARAESTQDVPKLPEMGCLFLISRQGLLCRVTCPPIPRRSRGPNRRCRQSGVARRLFLPAAGQRHQPLPKAGGQIDPGL